MQINGKLVFTLLLAVVLLFFIADSQQSCSGLPTCSTPRAGHKPSVNGCGPRHSKILNLLGNVLFKAFEECCNGHGMLFLLSKIIGLTILFCLTCFN